MTDHAEELRRALSKYREPRYDAWANECALADLAWAIEEHLPAVLAELDRLRAGETPMTEAEATRRLK